MDSNNYERALDYRDDTLEQSEWADMVGYDWLFGAWFAGPSRESTIYQETQLILCHD